MSQYFQSSNKRGELYELSEELNSVDYNRKKEAIKKVIAHMTIGKDVSPLFHQVVKCLEYDDVELKKLVYLYILNYSRNRPDDAIVVVQLFRKDIQNKNNPMLRALAVRTMGCLKVHKINEYLADPLRDALNDKEPYVRKTAVLCIPKLYEVSPDLVNENGLVQQMQELLQKEKNSLVLANLIVALQEISFIEKRNLLKMTPQVMQHLLSSVNECVEWGQIQIMEYLSNYVPVDQKEAELVVERILPRLSHINPSVVFTAVKVIIKYLEYIDSSDIVDHILQKVTPSLVSLLSWDKSEIKFIILKNINHILAKRPGLLDKHIKCFFCSFNEPYYIKHQKLDILARICDKKQSETVISELELYVSEPDPQFVRRSIQAICSVTIKFSSVAEKAIKIILTLIKNILEANMGGELYVQEIIIAMQKIFRKYPNKYNYENALKETVNLLEFASEEAAKSSAVWILGEFAEHIPTSIDLITNRIQNFKEEERGVQLEILTAAIKVFVKYPDDGKSFIQELLETAAYKTLNPDVRDRAFIYWRMLSSDPEQTKSTVLCDKPEIQEEGLKYEADFLNIMVDTLGQVTSIFQIYPNKLFRGKYRPPGTFYASTNSQPTKPKYLSEFIKEEEDQPQNNLKKVNNQSQNNNQNKPSPKKEEKKQPAQQEKQPEPKPQQQEVNLMDDLLDIGGPEPVQQQQQQQNNNNNNNQQQVASNDLLDLMDDFGGQQQQQQQQPVQQQQNNDDFDMFGDGPQQSNTGVSKYSVPLEQVMDQSVAGKRSGTTGLRIEAALNRVNSKTVLDMKIHNNTNQNITDVTLSLRQNYFGLKFENNTPQVNIPVNQSQQVQVPINTQGNQDQNLPNPPLKFDIGIKTNFDVFYFQLPCILHTIFSENGEMNKGEFRDNWKGVNDDSEMNFEVNNFNQNYKNTDNLQNILKQNNIFFVAQRQNDKGQTMGYYSCKTELGVIFTLEIGVPSLNNPNGANICCKSQQKGLIPLVLQAVNYILTH